MMRRRIMGIGIAATLLVASATPVSAAVAHVTRTATASSPAKTTLRKPVPAPGHYLVVVSVRARRAATTATLYLTGQPPRRAVRATRSGTRLAWRMFVKTKKIALLAVSTKPVRVTMTLSPRPAPHSHKKTKATVPPVVAPAAVAPAPVAPAPAPAPAPPPAPTVSTTPTSPPATIGGAYPNLLWSSTFNGAKGSAPPAAWSADAGSGCGAGTLSTTTSPASISNAQLDGNGNLAITALQTGPSSYTSAELSTIGSFSFMYGTIEARIWLPAGQGLCSAFWMVGNGPKQGVPCGPTCGELDVIEAPSFGAIPTTAVFTLHGPIQGSAQTQQFETDSTAPGNLAAGYHTYAATWTPTSITWSIDGVNYATATANTLVAGSQWTGTYSGDPFHIILDLAVGGWPCSGNACTPPPSATMLVNWVAVYQ